MVARKKKRVETQDAAGVLPKRCRKRNRGNYEDVAEEEAEHDPNDGVN